MFWSCHFVFFNIHFYLFVCLYNNKCKICLAPTHTLKEHALIAFKNKNETWATDEGQKNKQLNSIWTREG